MFKNEMLKQAIEESGLTYAELDRRMGTINTVSKYANGVRQPSPATLFRFLVSLGWDSERLKRERLTDWYEIAIPATSPQG